MRYKDLHMQDRDNKRVDSIGVHPMSQITTGL